MYVMGKRALTETATEDDMTRMAAAVQEALKAGAMGFSSSRASTHVTPDDTPVASRIAEWEEIDRIVGAMAELDAGIFQVGPDIGSGAPHRAFLERLRQVALDHQAADHVRRAGDQAGRRSQFVAATRPTIIDDTVAAGGRMFGQGTTRSINAIFSLKSYLPFDVLPAWQPIRALPIDEQKRRLAIPRCGASWSRPRRHEAARQDVPGRRCGDHRSAQARLRQPVRHEGRRLGRSHGRAARRGARASIRSR